MRYSIIASFAVAAVFSALATVSAQAQTWAADSPVNVERAVELEEGASAAMANGRRWSTAAGMLREASRLRSPNDPVAFADLRAAGVIYGTIGDYRRARQTMLELAGRATDFGEVSVAAHAFLDAAHVALALEDAEAVRRFYEQAERLARSSHLTVEEQQRLTYRLERTPTLFATRAN